MTDTGGKPRSPVGRWGTLALANTATLAISGALGTLPTYRLAGGEGLYALAAAAGAVWLAGAAGAVPVAMTQPADGRGVLTAVQLSMVVRFFVALAAAAALALGSPLPRATLFLWIAIHYLAALAVTVVVELKLLRTRSSESSA